MGWVVGWICRILLVVVVVAGGVRVGAGSLADCVIHFLQSYCHNSKILLLEGPLFLLRCYWIPWFPNRNVRVGGCWVVGASGVITDIWPVLIIRSYGQREIGRAGNA